jgi:hypothetical protein
MEYPEQMTKPISEVLGLMNFRTGPIAHAFREAGETIPERIEDEQAFVLHKFLLLALEHGENWQQEAGKVIHEVIEKVKEKKKKKK